MVRKSSYSFLIHIIIFFIFILVEIEQTQNITNGTQDPRFDEVFKKDKEKIIAFLDAQINTHLVRNDYKEIIEVKCFNVTFIYTNIITFLVLQYRMPRFKKEFMLDHCLSFYFLIRAHTLRSFPKDFLTFFTHTHTHIFMFFPKVFPLLNLLLSFCLNITKAKISTINNKQAFVLSNEHLLAH